jgi:hypothetical protein
VRENVAVVILTSETCDSSSNEETELLEALDGKYDALRDKLYTCYIIPLTSSVVHILD